MRWPMIVGGILIDFMGIVWMLQGLNILGGSPMTGDPFWVGAGGFLSMVGLLFVVLGMRPRSSS